MASDRRGAGRSVFLPIRACSTFLVLCLGALFLVSPSLARADEPSAADRETARNLLREGDEKFAARDFAGALKAYQAAHAIMQVPTTGLPLGKAQIEKGLLVEARDTLLQVSRFPKDPAEKPAFTQARDEATVLADKVAERIPSLVLVVEGAPAGAIVDVKIDGVPVPPETFGAPRKLNPGLHAIVASAPGVPTLTRNVSLRERDTERVVLTLGGSGSGTSGDTRITVGLSAAPTMALLLDGGSPHYGGALGFVFQVGLSPTFDLRTGITAGFLHRGDDDTSQLHVVVPVLVRVNYSPWFYFAAGLSAGFGTMFGDNQTGASVGPEWSILSMVAGDRRQYELSFTQGLRFGNVPSEYHQSLVFTYLFRE